MKFTHRFRVNAPLEAVMAFHSQASSLKAITPPPIIMRVHRAPPVLGEDDEMAFTMWLGPVPIRWLARIEQVTDHSFVDRQVSGPFAKWVHKHTFVVVDDETTVVLDEVNAALGPWPLKRLLSLGMWVGLPVLFAFRQWQTKRLLEDTT